MINSSLIHTDELFVWIDDFIKVTGVPTYAALQIYAECCYFQDPNALLERLISIENEYKLQLEDNGDADDLDMDGEIFSEHYGNYQLTLDTLCNEDAKKFADHYEKVLVHHGFKKQFSVYFIEHFHPLSEGVTSDAPAVDKRFLFSHQYSYTPFFTEAPEAPQYEWLNILERLDREPAIDPAGWIAVFKELGFCGIDSSNEPSWPDYEPSFIIGPPVAEARKFCEAEGLDFDEDDVDLSDIFENTPIYVTPFTITGPDIFSFDMLELRHELAKDEYEPFIILYAAPYILRAPDNKSFISIWGEIFDGETWKIMPLHAKSTSLEIILEDGFISGSEPNWQNVSTPDQPLVDIWQKHHRASEALSPSSKTSEVIGLNTDSAED